MPPKPVQLLLLLGLLFTSCSESISESDLRARVVFTGSEAADGCGWLLKISEELTYKPEQLEDEFKVDGTEVRISFRILDSSFSCGFPSPNSPSFQKIRLRRIEKI